MSEKQKYDVAVIGAGQVDILLHSERQIWENRLF